MKKDINNSGKEKNHDIGKDLFTYDSISVPANIVDDPELIAELEQNAAPTGTSYTHGPIPFPDHTEKDESLKDDLGTLLERIKQNDSDAQNTLGVKLLTGDGISPDPETAVKLLYLAASQGNPLALANLGKCSIEGTGIKQSYEHGIYLLSGAHLMGVESTERYILETVPLEKLTELSSAGNTLAQYYLGINRLTGSNTEEDVTKAFNYITSSAEKNEPLALIFLARCLTNGICVERDLLHAKHLLLNASDLAEKQVGLLGYQYVQEKLDEVENEIKDSYPFYLAKIITSCSKDHQPKDKYVKDFLDGKLFMKTLDQFGDLTKRSSSSSNSFRGDPFEGFTESYGLGYNPHLFTSDSNGQIVHDGQVGFLDVLKLREKVFCLTVINYDSERDICIKPDPQLKKFGDYAVIITDVQEFLRRVRRAVKHLENEDNANYWMAYDRVKYDVDLSQPLQFSEFHKSKSYKWQNEFRIAIDFSEGKFSSEILNNTTDFAKLTFPGKITVDTNPHSLSNTMYLEIGDIRDISVCVSVDELIGESELNIDCNKSPVFIPPSYPERNPRPTFCKGVTVVPAKDGEGFHFAFSEINFFSTLV